MNNFKMRFTLNGEVYETVIGAATSGSAIRLIEHAYSGAKNITVVG